jgi:glycosyltransferase involved in cell wall biosynthesis
MHPQLSIIIPHYDDVDNLVRCVSLLKAQSMAPSSFEIVVADNNSPVGIDVVRQAVGRDARVVEAPVQGAGPARNAAVAASTGSVLAFIDSDCRPGRDWLERGLAALAATDIVGGRVDIASRDPSRPNPIEAFEMATAFPIRDYVERKHFAVTANMFVPRPIFDKVGIFRSTVAEDMDWCHRAVAAGFSLAYADDVVVAHPARVTWHELSRKWRRTNAETFALTMERRGGAARWLLQCLLVLASIGPHAVKILITPKLKGLPARLGAVETLIRIRCFRFARGMMLLSGRG